MKQNPSIKDLAESGLNLFVSSFLRFFVSSFLRFVASSFCRFVKLEAIKNMSS